MLRTRIRIGTLLVLAISGILIGDAYFQPHAPFLMMAILMLGWSGTREFWHMLPVADRPHAALLAILVPLILLSNWTNAFFDLKSWPMMPVFGTVTFACMAVIVFEILNYTVDSGATRRIAYSVLIFIYLGLLPSFLVQLRWFTRDSGLAITATIFVPKICDIFALLTGMAFGRHPLTPTLSPKKTWEGFAGGMIAAMITAVVIHLVSPTLFGTYFLAILFGLIVGLAGVAGDLAESLFKRDCHIKDASATLPGFGGILDVIDSIIFAAPVAYFLLIVENL